MSRLQDLYTTSVSGKATPADYQELLDLLARTENEQEALQLIREGLNASYSAHDTMSEETLQLIQKTITGLKTPTDIPSPRIHFLKTNWFKYAASIILVVSAATYFWIVKNRPVTLIDNGSNALIAPMNIAPGRDRAILTLASGQQIILDSTSGDIVKKGSLTVVNMSGQLKYEGIGTNAEYNIISTPKGGQYQVILPDGSKIWLNAASSIKFPTAFTNNERKVEMSGEAYMEIASSQSHIGPNQPFIVKANGIEIQVLGTSFNVNAYEDETAIKTTLISGRVKLINNTTSSAILKPGQQAIVTYPELAKGPRQLLILNNPDIEQTLAWKNDLFNFNKSDLKTVMRELERWYDIKVKYEGPVPPIIFKGEMDRGVNLSDVLQFFSKMGIRFRLEGRILTVTQ